MKQPSNQLVRPEITLLKEEDFNLVLDGKQIELFTLSNQEGSVAQFTNYGARLLALWVPTKTNEYKDVVLGFSSINDYLKAHEQYHGATIGRYANRIAKGQFLLEGRPYQLATNNGENHLHGAPKGFESVAWDAEQINDQKICFSYLSKHMEAGYPGNLLVKVSYELTDENELNIQYHATTDQQTIINLTHHSYFNLKGEGSGTIENHLLKINTAFYTPLKEGCIPTGEIDTLNNTPLDFQSLIRIGDRIEGAHDQLEIGSGYDHNYVFEDDDKLKLMAIAQAPDDSIKMEVYSTEPGMQFYTGNFLEGSDIGKSGIAYQKRSGFCLETQHFPDSPNHTHFPSVVLEKGLPFVSNTIYRFS